MANDEEQEDLPERLTRALHDADQPPPLISARVDRELTALAQAHFAGRRRNRVPIAAWAAMAAVVLVTVLAVFRLEPAVDAPDVYADVDNSGGIDIADVLALARSQPGRYSQSELDAFARRIVSLDQADNAG